MSDSYQAIYDAVRSRFGGCDVGEAIQQAIRTENLGHYFAMAMEEIKLAAVSQSEPSAIYRPKLSIDGNMWCALYGENLQDGVAGFGSSPAEAMDAFNRSWFEHIAKAA
ncbi:hypothetical protein ACP3VF_10335 [Pseudomonas paraeruginosa]|uniref:hypothetical protein n=1 Tax=Pseudomonas paraeruginosa TaxID=2994495 RepID=UPI0021B072DD|nr:hypothetical protein [Pseudomonas aeruginosa]HEP8326530.1 hypothetical protein [Pseudomonas aeruginosa]